MEIYSAAQGCSYWRSIIFCRACLSGRAANCKASNTADAYKASQACGRSKGWQRGTSQKGTTTSCTKK